MVDEVADELRGYARPTFWMHIATLALTVVMLAIAIYSIAQPPPVARFRFTGPAGDVWLDMPAGAGLGNSTVQLPTECSGKMGATLELVSTTPTGHTCTGTFGGCPVTFRFVIVDGRNGSPFGLVLETDCCQLSGLYLLN